MWNFLKGQFSMLDGGLFMQLLTTDVVKDLVNRRRNNIVISTTNKNYNCASCFVFIIIHL